MPLTTGTRLGPYEIVNPIGAGGMGEVYRARDTKLNREVAIKVLPESFALDADRVARFTREAQVLASLNQPNIAAIYDIEESGNTRALVMELVEGEDLSAVIARAAGAGGRLPQSSGASVSDRWQAAGVGPRGMSLEDAIPIARQIADALEAAHEQGIVHRDLKPANIKVRADGTVKVLDFGLAKAMDPTGAASGDAMHSPTLTARATQMGMILGTAAYMAPEQAKGKPVDKRADIWAFGAVLFEMLSGRRPFDGEDTTDVLGAVVRLEPQWDALPATVPARVTQVLRACLQKDPKRRIGDMQSVRLALEGAFETVAPQTTATSATPRAGRRRMVATGALVVATAIVTALAVPAVTTLFRIDAPTLPTMRFEVSNPTTPNPVQFAVSPDGRYVVSVAGTEKGVALWLHAFEGSDRFLKDTDNGQDPFWSPDSRYIGFFANKKLKMIDITGGPARSIADTTGGLGGSWSEDGMIVFARDSRGPIYRVAATGGTPVAVTELDKTLEETVHVGPRFLPGGKRFMYLARSSKRENDFIVYLGSLDSRERKKLVDSTGWPGFSPPGYLLFQRATTLLAQALQPGSFDLTGEPQIVMEGLTPGHPNFARPGFSASRNGVLVTRLGGSNTNQLRWFTRSSSEPPVVIAAQEYLNPRLSPDGLWVAGEQAESGGGDIWLFDLARNTPTRFTFSEARDSNPIWSPDGQRIAFASDRDGAKGLYVKSTGGATPEELLLKNESPIFPSDWSSDGKYIVYTEEHPKTKADIWVVPVSGERKPVAAVQTPFAESGGQLSPDGRWIAYESTESGTFEVYVQSFPAAGNKWKISSNGGYRPQWRRNGKELFYSMIPNVMYVEITAQKPPHQFEVGIPQLAVRSRTTGSFGVTPDGQRFIVNGREANSAESSTLTVILNWAAALGARK
jgi:Tol biopolymer transport system component/tRNA A-37 threonylcarbamoyl transferase component Bud32